MHYADGTEAKVGDLVKGTCYNTKDAAGKPRVVVGEMIQITPGSDVCNCIVAFVEHKEATIDNLAGHYGGGSPTLVNLNAGRRFLTPKHDYSECKAFTLVHRPE
jgi:hypothetical protein